MDGLILVDKPRGATSHDIVARVRRCLGIRKVGHFGTLDPMATGLLLVAVGRAVKLFPLYSKHDKAYAGEIQLGLATDTYDATGQPTSPRKDALPGREAVVEAMRSFEGEILQTPPPYSAKKVSGKPLYKWARGRKEVSCPPRPVTVHSFGLVDFRPPAVEFEVRCGSGTYVRSLAHDLGRMLGCGAHLTGLRRISSGELTIDRALPVDRVEELVRGGRTGEVILPLEALLPGLPKVVLTGSGEGRLQRGRPLSPGDIERRLAAEEPAAARPDAPPGACRLFSLAGRFLGLAAPGPDPEVMVPFLILTP